LALGVANSEHTNNADNNCNQFQLSQNTPQGSWSYTGHICLAFIA